MSVAESFFYQTGGNPWFGHALFSSSRSTPSPPSVPGGGASGSGGVPIASPSLRHNTAVATSHERERERLSSGGSFSWLGDPPSGGQQETGIGGLGGGGAVNLIVGSPHFYDSPLCEYLVVIKMLISLIVVINLLNSFSRDMNTTPPNSLEVQNTEKQVEENNSTEANVPVLRYLDQTPAVKSTAGV